MIGFLLLLLASPFAGTWEGKLNGLPTVEITVAPSGGGAAVFYLQMLNEVSGEWRVKGRNSTPLLKPKVKAMTMTFEVKHNVRHGSTERGPNTRFRLELTAPNEARLYHDPPDEMDPLLLTRR